MMTNTVLENAGVAGVMGNGVRSALWHDVYGSAIEQVEEKDARKINEMCFDLANVRKIKNFGLTSARELVTALSVFIAENRL